MPNAQLIPLQNHAKIWASPFPSEALLCKGYFWGAAHAEVWQSNRTENLPLSCTASIPHIPQIPLVLTKATPGVCQDEDGEKDLGVWPVIIVTIKESSAAVIPMEKDGNHSLPLLFALAKYENF